MIQRTAFKALLEHKGQLVLLGFTCLVESLSIVGQAWFFGTLINNFIFFSFQLVSNINFALSLVKLFISYINLATITLAIVPARVANNAPGRVHLVFVTFAVIK